MWRFHQYMLQNRQSVLWNQHNVWPLHFEMSYFYSYIWWNNLYIHKTYLFSIYVTLVFIHVTNFLKHMTAVLIHVKNRHSMWCIQHCEWQVYLNIWHFCLYMQRFYHFMWQKCIFVKYSQYVWKPPRSYLTQPFTHAVSLIKHCNHTDSNNVCICATI